MPNLSTITELQNIPINSKFIQFVGQVVDIKVSEKKCTVLMKCKEGEIVAVTAFKEAKVLINHSGIGKVRF